MGVFKNEINETVYNRLLFYDCNKLDKLFHKPTATLPKVHSRPCLEQIKGKLVQCILHSIQTKKTLFIVIDKASVYCNLSILTDWIKRLIKTIKQFSNLIGYKQSWFQL